MFPRERDMAYIGAMNFLTQRFPIKEVVKWQEYLAKAMQTKLFRAILSLMAQAGAVWELLATSGTKSQGGANSNWKGSVAAHNSFYGEAEDAEKTREDSRKCFQCSEEGHIAIKCPKKGSGSKMAK